MKKYKINVMKWNLEKYDSTPLFYQKFQVLLLMENANTHLVSIFKDYLLFDDMTEFFKDYYNSKEIYPRLKTIFDYYESSSYLFPNYTAINEGKYIYRNIIKKQKLIDYLEDLEDKKKEKEEKQKLKKKKYQNKNEQSSSSSCIEVFNTKIYDNIRKETWNDSKINNLFCVDNKNNSESDSLASLVKLTEIIQDKDIEEDKEKQYIKCIIIDKGISDINNNKDNKSKENNNNKNNINNSINEINNKDNNNKENINKIKKENNIINKEYNNNIKNIQNVQDNKIYVSRRISIHQGSNKKIYIKRPEAKLNINNYANNNNTNSNLNIIANININSNTNIDKNINYNLNANINSTNNNLSNMNKNLNTEPSKSNDFIKNSQNKIYQKKQTNSSKKNTYKKNNIIINIINNNKNNNFNTNNYFSNNNTNENFINNNCYNSNNFRINNNCCPNNYANTNENQNQNQNNKNINNFDKIKLNNIKNNNSVKNNHHNIKTNINTNFSKLNNNDKIKGQISSKGLTVRNTINNNSKKIIKRTKNEIKSKVLSFRLTTDILSTNSNLMRNLTERIRKQTQSNSIKKDKQQKSIKNAFSPRKNVKKRTKTEITGAKSDIFLLGQQKEINQYNKSINRQILKNINLTNTNKQKKEISLVNKKIVNSHFNLNTGSKAKIKTKYIKHSSTNSQNLTSLGIMNKITPLPIKDIVRKKVAVFSFNKTERTSRNHSKDKMNKINKTIIKRNNKESFSPKKSQELIYNKIHRIKNRNNNIIICSFLKGVSSNQKMKNLKIKRKSNNSNVKSVNINPNNKEFFIKINKDKKQ